MPLDRKSTLSPSEGRALFARLEGEMYFRRNHREAMRVVATWNAEIAPRVHTEEAALQSLAQWLAYQPLPVGARLALDIDEDLQGAPRPYDVEYAVREI